jgi:hypothetical protein
MILGISERPVRLVTGAVLVSSHNPFMTFKVHLRFGQS